MIAWGEPKRRTNLKKHQIVFSELEPCFDWPMITMEDASVSTSKAFSAKEIAAAKAAAKAVPEQPGKDWRRATVTPGGGVTKTIAAIHRVRGPNKRPTKEQVAIRLDPGVLGAFRAAGPGWQTRMNNALKEWLAEHPSKAKPKRAT